MHREMAKENLEDLGRLDDEFGLELYRGRSIPISGVRERKILVSVEAHILRIEAEKDNLVKHQYLKEMVEFIKEKGKIRDYLKGVRYTRIIDKRDLNIELANSMAEKFPIFGGLLRRVYPWVHQ